MHFSPPCLTPNPIIISPGLSLRSLVLSPSLFVCSLKLSQQVLPAPGLGSVSPFATRETHQQTSDQAQSELPHGQKKAIILAIAPASQTCVYEIGFLLLSVAFHATEGIEENTTWTPTLFTNHHSPLKSFSIILKFLSATSLLLA